MLWQSWAGLRPCPHGAGMLPGWAGVSCLGYSVSRCPHPCRASGRSGMLLEHEAQLCIAPAVLRLAWLLGCRCSLVLFVPRGKSQHKAVLRWVLLICWKECGEAAFPFPLEGLG